MQICLFLVFKLCLHIAKAAEEMEFFIVTQQLVHLQGSRWTGNTKFIIFLFQNWKHFLKHITWTWSNIIRKISRRKNSGVCVF